MDNHTNVGPTAHARASMAARRAAGVPVGEHGGGSNRAETPAAFRGVASVRDHEPHPDRAARAGGVERTE